MLPTRWKAFVEIINFSLEQASGQARAARISLFLAVKRSAEIEVRKD
jgi:hypothetical protein